jgi:hypothetical protein
MFTAIVLSFLAPDFDVHKNEKAKSFFPEMNTTQLTNREDGQQNVKKEQKKLESSKKQNNKIPG